MPPSTNPGRFMSFKFSRSHRHGWCLWPNDELSCQNFVCVRCLSCVNGLPHNAHFTICHPLLHFSCAYVLHQGVVELFWTFALPFPNASASSLVHPCFYMVFFRPNLALSSQSVPICLLFALCAAWNGRLCPTLGTFRVFFDASVTIGQCVRYFSNAKTTKKKTFYFANDAFVRKQAQQLPNWKLTTKYARISTKKSLIVWTNYNVSPFFLVSAFFPTCARHISHSSVLNKLFKPLFDNEYVFIETLAFTNIDLLFFFGRMRFFFHP